MSSAVLLTCHGTVDDVDDLPEFLRNIRRGRPTPPELVLEVRRRFLHIGGSPLMAITALQAKELEARLGVPVRIAARLWRPMPKDVVAEMVEGGVREIVSIPLAPQSVDVYHATVREAAALHPGLTVRYAPPWGGEAAFVDATAELIEETLARVPEAERASIPIVLTAHSLPQRVIDSGDPYEREFRELAAHVGDRVGVRGNPIVVAFQSQGMTGDQWLGPDLLSTFERLAGEGARSAVVAPIGFVSDHVETLYDLDVEAQAMAAKIGLGPLFRAPALNARPRFIDALEAIARREIQAFRDAR